MKTDKIKKLLTDYNPCNEQEEKDKAFILSLINDKGDALLYRSSEYAHITVSAWVINNERSKVLMAFHNIYNSWAWLGGHADGEGDLIKVAVNEACEESGIVNPMPLSEELFSVEVLTVNGHKKGGEYVSSHLHLNFTFCLIADESEALKIKHDENSDVSWILLDDVLNKSNEKWFIDNIYPKLIKKTES